MPNYQKAKFSCYFTYLALSSVFCLPPMLFVTFREMYGISYTLLGTLVLINFCTQLVVDLVFSFFGKYFNIHKTIRIMPLITAAGMTVYALVPMLMPQYAYAGLLAGTFIFSVAAGLSEVLLSPLIAAIPSKTPDRDMSLLHSLYAYGVLTVVLISTVFLQVFGRENWMYLTLGLAVLPIICCVLFCTSTLPPMELSHSTGEQTAKKRTTGLALCALCIFLGGAAENTMTNWISSYLENVLRISKTLCDIIGLALFAVLLGVGRTWYAKRGKNIYRVLVFGMVGAVVCYLVAALSPVAALSLLGCVLTGICTSMLWPGTLILMEERIPGVGVTAYALMAAAGDFGSSVAPQLHGMVVDSVSVSRWAAQMGEALSISSEQVGMKLGMLIAALFPLLGVVVLMILKRKLPPR